MQRHRQECLCYWAELGCAALLREVGGVDAAAQAGVPFEAQGKPVLLGGGGGGEGQG